MLLDINVNKSEEKCQSIELDFQLISIFLFSSGLIEIAVHFNVKNRTTLIRIHNLLFRFHFP